MAQFECPICGAGFEQKSRFERHMMTSHPKQAPSAASIQSILKGIGYPKSKEELVEYAKQQGADDEIISLLKALPRQEYRDSAEVARAFGQLKTHEEKPAHQPSKLGGKHALESTSAAAFASAFSGVELPKTASELRDYVREKNASDDIIEVVDKLPEKSYHDMAEIEKEASVVMS